MILPPAAPVGTHRGGGRVSRLEREALRRRHWAGEVQTNLVIDVVATSDDDVLGLTDTLALVEHVDRVLLVHGDLLDLALRVVPLNRAQFLRNGHDTQLVRIAEDDRGRVVRRVVGDERRHNNAQRVGEQFRHVCICRSNLRHIVRLL